MSLGIAAGGESQHELCSALRDPTERFGVPNLRLMMVHGFGVPKTPRSRTLLEGLHTCRGLSRGGGAESSSFYVVGWWSERKTSSVLITSKAKR